MEPVSATKTPTATETQGTDFWLISWRARSPKPAQFVLGANTLQVFNDHTIDASDYLGFAANFTSMTYALISPAISPH